VVVIFSTVTGHLLVFCYSLISQFAVGHFAETVHVSMICTISVTVAHIWFFLNIDVIHSLSCVVKHFCSVYLIYVGAVQKPREYSAVFLTSSFSTVLNTLLRYIHKSGSLVSCIIWQCMWRWHRISYYIQAWSQQLQLLFRS